MIGGESMKGGLSVLRHNRIPNYDDIEDAFKAIGRSLVAVKNQKIGPPGKSNDSSHQ